MSEIRRVWGTADSIQLTFSYNDTTGRWEAAVPAPDDGRYVVSLYAEDAAGNVAYIAKMLFTIDLRNMCVTFKVLEIGSDISMLAVDSAVAMKEITSLLVSLDGCKKGIGGCNG